MTPYLQPIFADRDGLRLVGWELLCRPRPPGGGPAEWAVRGAALAGFVRAGLPGTLFLNLRPGEAADPVLGPRLLELAGRAGLPPRRLAVELPEGEAGAVCAVPGLRRAGVRVFLDDLGAAASPFRLLLGLGGRVDGLKVERAGAWPAPLLRGLLGLAGALGAVVVAEGVETGRQLSRLKELGFTHFQGYYLGRPLPLGLLEALRYGCRPA